MILLRHLRITAFKHLRNVDLWLPRSGSVLIEGHNESGKSTLFEAIYFALYGKALVGEETGNPSLEALLPHGESRASLQLTIRVGATEMEITRTLTRGQKLKHDAEVRVHRPDRPVETISAVTAVNDCILTEMNGLDSTVLRNSCLMEQQALDRIETLTNANREMAIAKLLGIDAIQRIEQELKVNRKDSDSLDQAERRLDAARKQQEAQQAAEVAQAAAARLRAARARAALDARDSLVARIAEARGNLENIARETAQVGERSQRADILQTLLASGEENAGLLRAAEQEANALELLRAEQAHVASAADIATARDRLATLRQLEAELRRLQSGQAIADATEAEGREHEQHARVTAASSRTRTAAVLAAVAFVVMVSAAALGVLGHLLWLLPVALVSLLIGIILAVRWQRLRTAMAGERAKLATIERETVRLRALHEATQQFGIGSDEQKTALGAHNATDVTARQTLEDVRNRIRALGIEPDVTHLTAERIAVEHTVAHMIQQTEATPTALSLQQQKAAAARDTLAHALHEQANALTAAGIAVPAESLVVESVADMRRVHGAVEQSLQTELARLDMQTTQRRQGSLDAREQHLRDEHDELVARHTAERRGLAMLLAEQGIAATGDEPREALVLHWPALAESDSDPEALAAAVERAQAVTEQLRREVETRCRQYGFDAETLDAEACQQAYDEIERTLRHRKLAAEMADDVFKRIVKRVLPETEMHMRALLPDLTDGRYRDVSLLSDDENSADLSIGVWDEQAGRYVGKHLFSGGTRDQVSLALRLAFALATLPKELGAMPGFIFLDEPLSSFDDRRSQALVDVLTRGPIARQFPQVFLISHSQSFDPDAFTCSLRMAAGRVATSTLPSEADALALWQEN